MEFIFVIVAVVGVFFLIKKIRGPIAPTKPPVGGGGDGTDGTEVKNPNQI